MATARLFLSQPYKNGEDKSDKKVLNPKETRIYISIIIDHDRIIKIRTPHTILPKDWDFSKQGMKDRLAGSMEFNQKLQNLRKLLLDMYDKAIGEHPDYDDKAVASLIKEQAENIGKPNNSAAKGFFPIFDEFLEYVGGELTPGTVKKFKTLKKSLEAFSTTNKRYTNLSFSIIDHKFKDDYTSYLREQPARGRQKNRPEGEQTGLLNDTIGKYIESLKTFCRWAEERGYNKNTTYSKFSNVTKANKKRKKRASDIVTLTLQELYKLYRHNFSDKPHLDRVRDLFCFGAFTGQRWADINNFEKSQLRDDVWCFVADKTKKETEIDLTGYAAPAMDILKKYKFKLPEMTLKNMNDYIKEAAEEAGIKEETSIKRYVGAKEIVITNPKYKFVSSHTARRTCVSMLLNDYNINVVHVMEITNHADLKTLMKYIKKDRTARRQAVERTAPVTKMLLVTHKKAV
ncbi:MAG TPA: phage integrase SAM-like domain-containing protein [Bacteroidales bacterium]|nr:phage integrase SAM-like domain-containing protein [Bacteroidales bacterium]